jgi:hypothetical protein
MFALFLLAVVVLVTAAPSPLAGTVAWRFGMPLSLALDDQGDLFVLDAQDQTIKKVQVGDPVPQVLLMLDLDNPVDLELDGSGDLVVAAGLEAPRLVVFTLAGQPVREVALDEGFWLQRLARADNGPLHLLVGDGAATRILRFDSNYQLINSIDVTYDCPSETAHWPVEVMDVAEDGTIWVGDVALCGTEYVLRKYDSDGTQLGMWQREGQLSQGEVECLAADGALVHGIADIFIAGDDLFVVLGASSEKGGLEVDQWTTSGTWVQRTELSGAGDPMVRARVHGTKVYLADTLGMKSVFDVDLDDLQ